jgi:hypothetical protein
VRPPQIAGVGALQAARAAIEAGDIDPSFVVIALRL